MADTAYDYPVAAEVGIRYDTTKLIFEGWEGEPEPRFQWMFWFRMDGTYVGPKNIAGRIIVPLFNYKSLQDARIAPDVR